MSLWFIHGYMLNAVKAEIPYCPTFDCVFPYFRTTPWTVNYRNRLPPALCVRIWFLTKCLLRDYVGFDRSSDRSSNASQRFFDNPSHDKLYCRCLPIIYSIHSLLVITWGAVCVLSLISALSLSLSLSLSLLFFHSNSWVLLTWQKASVKSPDNTRRKGNNICLSAYFYVQKTKGKNTEIDRGQKTSQRMQN